MMHRKKIMLFLWGMAILMFLGNVDFIAITLSIPSIANHYEINVYFSQWINIAYIVAATSFALLGGALSDIISVKYQFYIGLFLFALAVTLAAISSNFIFLIIARFIQGFAYGMAFPLIYILTQKVVAKEDIGFASNMIVLSTAIAQAIAPVVASVVLYILSWRFLFLLNVPFCCLVAFLTKDIAVTSRKGGRWASSILPSLITLILLCLMLLSFVSILWFIISIIILLCAIYCAKRNFKNANNIYVTFIEFIKCNRPYVMNLIIRFFTQMLFIIILTYPAIYLYAEHFSYAAVGLTYLIFTGFFAVTNLCTRNSLNDATAPVMLKMAGLLQVFAFVFLVTGALIKYTLFSICIAFLIEGVAIGLLFSSTLFVNLKTSRNMRGIFSGLFLTVALSGCLFGLSFTNHLILICSNTRMRAIFSPNFSDSYFIAMSGGLLLASITLYLIFFNIKGKYFDKEG